VEKVVLKEKPSMVAGRAVLAGSLRVNVKALPD
jgi:hypothetical protein